jgi:hypothetical protein
MRDPAAQRLGLNLPERVIELPEYLHCERHGDYAWERYYDDNEIIQMLDERGSIDCPECLAEIVGVE